VYTKFLLQKVQQSITVLVRMLYMPQQSYSLSQQVRGEVTRENYAS